MNHGIALPMAEQRIESSQRHLGNWEFTFRRPVFRPHLWKWVNPDSLTYRVLFKISSLMPRRVIDRDNIKINIVVNQGLDHALDVTLSAAVQITAWFLGLTDGTPTVAAGDTPASHAGWVEVTAYSETVRQTWTDGGVSAQSVSNSASQARFTINVNGTVIGGAFLTSLNTKGGTTGTLYAAGAFTAGDKTLDNLDTVDVTATFTAVAS